MKKEVVISTFFGSENYGSNLQSIALSKTIEKEGYKVYFLGDFKVFNFILKHPTLLYARIINKLNRNQLKTFFNPVPYEKTEKRIKRIKAVNDTYYTIKSYYSSVDWKEAVENKTIFVSGSDIIWNPAQGYPTKKFLDFAYYANLPRFSYGSSIGALRLPKKYYSAYRRYLGSMIEVGVREQSVANMLEPIIQRKIKKVVDPTLLLTAKEWDEFADKAEVSVPVSKDGFVLCYYVMNDQRYWDYVKRIKQTTEKQIIVLPMHHLDEEQPYDVILDGTIYEFIWLIKNADFICTDSFHACAISLIYQKEFYLLRRTRKAEDAKYDDFLNRYDLTERNVSDESQFVRMEHINYDKASKRLEEDRAISLHFLEATLAKC